MSHPPHMHLQAHPRAHAVPKRLHCGTSCSQFQIFQETNVSLCEHKHSPAVVGRCYQVSLPFFIRKKKKTGSERKEKVEYVLVCKKWKVSFEVGVSNVQVERCAC